MLSRKLADLSVSAIGLGCMSMSQGYGQADREESKRCLSRALDLGYRFFDTASIYGQGHNEKLLGEVLSARRDEFVLASKCGIVIDEDGRRGVDGRPESIIATCEASLVNLQTEMIDLYYLHRRDFDVPIEESVGALARLIEQGKICHIGLSEVSSSTLRKAHKEHAITAVQSEYSLWSRDPETKVLATCAELGVGFVPFSPLGRGFLTGVITDADQLDADDMRQHMPRFKGEDFEKNLRLLQRFKQIAQDNHCSGAQLALAWLLAQPGELVPIPGTKHVSYVEENAAACELSLSQADISAMGELINADTVAGARYAESMMISLDPE